MIINVKVTTNAKTNEIIKIDDNNFKIKVTCVPEKGKANEKIIKMLSKYFKTAKSNIQIIKGESNSSKIIEITI